MSQIARGRVAREGHQGGRDLGLGAHRLDAARRRRGLGRLVLIALLPGLALAAPRPIFNGHDLTGWAHEGTRPSFFALGGELRTHGRAHAGNWLHTTAEFENFRFSFEYKLAQWAEAAVILRAPASQRPQHAGVTIVLAHDFHKQTSRYVTGAVMGLAEPLRFLGPSYEAWHRVEIEFIDRRLKVKIDGEAVQDLDVPEHRLRRGYLGFPDMGYAYAIRNLSVDDLGAPTRIADLLAAGTLTGWQRRGESGQWSLDRGILTGANGSSILYAPGEYGNFELTTVVRSHNRTNGGIFLRGAPEGAWRGFEIQVYSPVDAVYPTGSIYGVTRSRLSADLEGRWFLLQARLEGARCRVWVDGELVAETDQLSGPQLKPGRIGFQIHLDNTHIEFRDVRVRSLE